MKKSVIDIQDLQETNPLFKSRFGRFLGKLFIKCICIDKVNKVHANSCDKRGAAFTSSLLSDPLINLRYEVHNAQLLDHLPKEAFITVSNHPIGSLDGVILIDIFAARRSDFKVMANGVLTKIGALEDNFVSVKPDSNKRGANSKNVNGVRVALSQLTEGHPIGFFPAGAISFKNKSSKKILDLPWALSVARLIRKTRVPVYPVYFDFVNSGFFYWLGQISWKIRTLRIPAEVFNKRKKVVDVYIGEPIYPEEIKEIEDDRELADFFYMKTYSVKNRQES